jgi:hypothetical protein
MKAVRTILNLYKKGALDEDEAMELIENLVKGYGSPMNNPLPNTISTPTTPWPTWESKIPYTVTTSFPNMSKNEGGNSNAR